MALGAVSAPRKTWEPPVGMIITTGSPTSPAELYDGTSWTQIKDCFLIGAGGSYSLGSTGGSFSHTLTTEEMPAHTHTVTITGVGAHTHTISCAQGKKTVYASNSYWWYPYDKTNTTSSNGSHTHTISCGSTGGNSPFSTLNPYAVKYIWRRIA